MSFTAIRRAAVVASGAAVLIGGLLFPAAPAEAAPPCPRAFITKIAPIVTVDALRESCTQAQFDALFARGEAGPIPRGVYNGQARLLGSPDPGFTAAVSGIWSGKIFHNGWLVNRTIAGDIVPADVYTAPSVADGRPVIRIDYRRSGLPVGHDELRRLPNGVYLGYGFLGTTKAGNFWLWR